MCGLTVLSLLVTSMFIIIYLLSYEEDFDQTTTTIDKKMMPASDVPINTNMSNVVFYDDIADYTKDYKDPLYLNRHKLENVWNKKSNSSMYMTTDGSDLTLFSGNLMYDKVM